MPLFKTIMTDNHILVVAIVAIVFGRHFVLRLRGLTTPISGSNDTHYQRRSTRKK